MIKLWEAWGTQFSRGNSMDVVSSFAPTNPRCNITLKDNSTWYYKKTSATVALVWYNVTQGADAQWRKRWFHHLLVSEPSVLLWQSMFDKEDVVVHLWFDIQRQTRRSISYIIQMITNDLVSGIESKSIEM
jgi:hypothetical protein